MRELLPFAGDLDFHLEEYAGGRGQIPPKKRRKRNTVYVATIEKANLLVNSLISLGRMEEIGLCVVDEVSHNFIRGLFISPMFFILFGYSGYFPIHNLFLDLDSHTSFYSYIYWVNEGEVQFLKASCAK